MIYFTSDHHFHHKKILDFTDRPFNNTEEMNEGLVKSWNNVVKNNDTVYHLGDFSFGKYGEWINVLSRLNGKIILIKGNHDSSKKLNSALKDGYIYDMHEVGAYIKLYKQQLWLTHYPMEIGIRPRKFSIHGHIHDEESTMINQINVGVDNKLFSNNFGEPISIDILFEHIEKVNPILEEEFYKRRGLNPS